MKTWDERIDEVWDDAQEVQTLVSAACLPWFPWLCAACLGWFVGG
jgi:hypothetical protein